MHNIKDFDLPAGRLERKYRDAEEHPCYTLHQWRCTVSNRGTLFGYWNWVRQELIAEQDQLDRDNPYSPKGHL